MVFSHPGDPARLVKVVKAPPKPNVAGWRLPKLVRHLLGQERLRTMFTEQSEAKRLAKLDRPVPVSRLEGFVQTNLGMATVAETIFDVSGNLAPTLAEMSANRALTQEHLQYLNKTISDLFREAVSVNDVNPGNFVFGFRADCNGAESAEAEWLMVDGFGRRKLFSSQAVSRRLRRRKLARAFQSIDYPGLLWDQKERRFRFAD